MPKAKIRSADEIIPKRPKQRPLPGMERPVAKAIEEAADNYVNIRDRRIALAEKEAEAHGTLLLAMKAHKLDRYRYDEVVVVVDSTERVRVKRADDNGDD